jgi:hypothetical protein
MISGQHYARLLSEILRQHTALCRPLHPCLISREFRVISCTRTMAEFDLRNPTDTVFAIALASFASALLVVAYGKSGV